MRDYVVQPNDSPARIAIQYAGCPKCTIDLVRANPHKQAVRYPNGFVTFREMQAGETLKLPEKWFSKRFDELPPVYFKALPHPDGKTPSTLGGALAASVLGGYSKLDAAVLAVSALATKNDRAFYADLDGTAALVDASVKEASANAAAAQVAATVRTATDRARIRNLDLGIALDAGNAAAAMMARLDSQSSLSAALGAAQITLQVLYTTPGYEIEIGEAEIDPPPAPTPAPKPAPAPAPKPTPAPVPSPPVYVATTTDKGLSTGAIFGMGLLGAGVVGGAIYLATHRK